MIPHVSFVCTVIYWTRHFIQNIFYFHYKQHCRRHPLILFSLNKHRLHFLNCCCQVVEEVDGSHYSWLCDFFFFLTHFSMLGERSGGKPYSLCGVDADTSTVADSEGGCWYTDSVLASFLNRKRNQWCILQDTQRKAIYTVFAPITLKYCNCRSVIWQ